MISFTKKCTTPWNGGRRKWTLPVRRVRSDQNLIILVAESCDYRVSGANQGFACHRVSTGESAGTTDVYIHTYVCMYIHLYVCISFICVPRCNLVRSRRMLLTGEGRSRARLGVNDRIAIIRARLITRTAFITALLLFFSPSSPFLLHFFPLSFLYLRGRVGTGLPAFASYYSFHNADAAKLCGAPSGSHAIFIHRETLPPAPLRGWIANFLSLSMKFATFV